MPDLEIQSDDPYRPDVMALIADHLNFANQQSPPEDVHALDLSELAIPEVTFFTVREGEALLGMGAMRELDSTHGELKSMHTAMPARGRGVGRAMVEHLIALARSRGYERLSLETGTMDAFAPSRALYRSVGFAECPPFADYTDSPYSLCMTLEL